MAIVEMLWVICKRMYKKKKITNCVSSIFKSLYEPNFNNVEILSHVNS